MGETICDFCRQPPKWEYRTRPFAATITVVGAPTGNGGEAGKESATVLMDEGWHACDTCSELIEAGELGKLSARADVAQQARRPASLSAHERNLLRTALIALHQQFAGARTGERRPL